MFVYLLVFKPTSPSPFGFGSTQYFLQLKTDVLECRLHCNYEQAVMLASYSLQAELGDYDADRHSAQYIREFSLFPKVGWRIECWRGAVFVTKLRHEGC